jgi:RHS repeat-associated protein
VTQSFPLVLDHDFPVNPPRPCSGQAGWIDKGHSPAYNTAGDVASDHPQSVTVVIDPQTNLKCDDEKAGGAGPSCSGCGGGKAPAGNPMAEYTINSMLVSLSISDTPFRYSPAYGPAVNFTVTYNEREKQPTFAPNSSNLGPQWTFHWLAYVIEDPAGQRNSTAVYMPGGGAEIFTYDAISQAFITDPQSHAVLVKNPDGSYERDMPDGSKQIFTLSDNAPSYPRRIFMTRMIDAANNPVDLGYDGTFRLKDIIDAQQRHTTLTYGLAEDRLKITEVADQLGRVAMFDYENGLLKRITDQIGIQSQFTYVPGTHIIDSLTTTPYGTTSFARGQNGTNRWIEATDPLGGTERVEYRDNAPGIGGSDPVAPSAPGITNANLDLHNTFYWDKRAMEVAPRDYTMAQITHWLLNADETVSGIVSSKKQPLENRVWFTYDGQPDYQHLGTTANPSQIVRILGDSDSSQQISAFEYNSIGNTTKTTDPRGRVTTYSYHPNQIDLFEVRQVIGTDSEVLRQFPSYNSLHEPLTEVDAAGQPTFYEYTAQGQIRTRKNALSEITTYTYGGTAPDGYLETITSPTFNGLSAVTTFAYDHLNRVHTVKNEADQYIVTTDYDALDRKTMVTYMDGTFEQFQYTDNMTGVMTLDLTGSSDRLGRWTLRHYDANRHMDSITDPLLRTTHYEWCTCGSLVSITDPIPGNKTTFMRDIQSRVYQKVFADNSTIDYLFEGQTAPNTVGKTSRLKSSTDANGQTTNYAYAVDDNLTQVSYLNALHPTPTVNYLYDEFYNRVKCITDGIGSTHYEYYSVGVLGAGKVRTISGPLPYSTITLGYDELGRVTSQDINGTPANTSYDSLGRAGASHNALGDFGRTYDGVTVRLKTLNYPNGQHATYSYFDNLHDRRLKRIKNTVGGPPNLTLLLSQHDYTYDATGQIQTWNKVLGDDVTNLSFGYDNADQLTSVYNGRTQFSYEYDPAGNRLVDAFYTPGRFAQHGGTFYTANSLNELDTVSTDPGYGFASGPFPVTYDLNGNMTDDGGNRTFEWDAANRLVAINYKHAGNRTEFVYDGLGRRVKILEYDASTAATIEPGSGQYETFSVGPFFGPAGSYTLLLQGQNANGGLNAMLLDGVTLDGNSVPNGSFESPALSDYQYRPADAAWTYGDSAGITANGGKFSGSSEPAPDGAQSGFIEGTGSLWRTFTLASGTHTFSFQAAQAVSLNESSQQVRVTLLGLPTSTKTFVWSGNSIAEERDATGMIVAKRFFPEGEQRVGGAHAGNYYYSRDHLGSVREVTDASGVLQVQYDYDAWGNQVVVTGNMSFDFGYTGHYRHSPSNLYLAKYRAYDPAFGRWLSRDPSKDAELRLGGNLFAYVKNNSPKWIDLLGLQDSVPTPQPGTHPTPSSPPEGIDLSAAGQALLAGMVAGVGPVVPGSELLDAAALAPSLGELAVLNAFEKACLECVTKALCDRNLKCDVCDDWESLKERFKK